MEEKKIEKRGTVIEKPAEISIVALSHVLHGLAFLFYLALLPDPSKKPDNNASEAHSRVVTNADLRFNEWLRKPGRLGALRSLHNAKKEKELMAAADANELKRTKKRKGEGSFNASRMSDLRRQFRKK